MQLNSHIYIRVFKKEWSHLLKRVKEYLKIEKARKFQVESLRFSKEGDSYFQEIDRLFKSYNDARWNIKKFLKANFKVDEELLPSNIPFPTKYEEGETRLYFGELKGNLEEMEKEIEKTLVLLDELSFQITLPQEKKEELRSLEKIVDNEIFSHLPDYASDLKESINYFRKGFSLGATLIAGRVISGGLDKVNSKIPSEKRKEWESLSQEERNERWWSEIEKF